MKKVLKCMGMMALVALAFTSCKKNETPKQTFHFNAPEFSYESLDEESFNSNLLEYPQYTRPEVYKGMEVPSVLTGGNHEEIRKWRLRKSLQKTLMNRPDLIAQARLTGTLTLEAEKMIEELAEHLDYKNDRKQKRKLRSVQERLKRLAAKNKAASERKELNGE